MLNNAMKKTGLPSAPQIGGFRKGSTKANPYNKKAAKSKTAWNAYSSLQKGKC